MQTSRGVLTEGRWERKRRVCRNTRQTFLKKLRIRIYQNNHIERIIVFGIANQQYFMAISPLASVNPQ